MGASHSSSLHVMRPVEMMAEFGMTEPQVMEFEKSFNALRGKSASITHAQWMDHWNGQESPRDPDNVELGERIWKAFDVDGNGKMDLAEWSLFCAISQYGSQRHKLTASFAICDKSQDGLISLTEVENVLRRTMRMNKREEVKKQFTKEDGTVDPKDKRKLKKESNIL